MNTAFKEIILNSLNEDLSPRGDITSHCLIEKNHNSTFNLIVNEDAILAGINVFQETFKLLDKQISIKSDFKDGDEIRKNQVIASVYGNTLSILKAERTSLNFISHLSGIATITRKLNNLIKDTGVVLLDTRKTTPNLRLFEKDAVISGGGKNHRFNLSEMVLIKDNHIVASGGIKEAITKAKEKFANKLKIEVEVRNINELNQVIPCKPDIIMFDNWKVSALKDVLKLVPSGILTEASGQISIENIRDYAESGVHYISTSYMVKNAKWIDFSLEAIEQIKNEV